MGMNQWQSLWRESAVDKGMVPERNSSADSVIPSNHGPYTHAQMLLFPSVPRLLPNRTFLHFSQLLVRSTTNINIYLKLVPPTALTTKQCNNAVPCDLFLTSRVASKQT